MDSRGACSRRGLAATWMRGLSYTGFRIGLYPTTRDEALRVFGGDGVGARVLAGAVTGGIGAVVFNPIDVVRVRMQSSECGYRSTVGAFAEGGERGRRETRIVARRGGRAWRAR